MAIKFIRRNKSNESILRKVTADEEALLATLTLHLR